MYRIVLYGLGLLLIISAILGLTGAISVDAPHLVISIIVLTISCYATNRTFSTLLNVPSNSESWLISALILACILPQANSANAVLYTALAGIFAIASKFIIRFHGSHLLNPAAFGALVVSITSLLPAIWWIATPWLTPFTAFLAFAILRKQRKFGMFFCFALASIGMLILTSTVLQGISLSFVLHNAVMSWPIVFFGSIMLTEPATLPPTRYYQFMLAIIIGLLFTSQVHIGRLGSTPEVVLIVGNLLAALALPAYGYILRLKEIKQLAPNIYEISFNRPSTLKFAPGQHAELTLSHLHPDNRGNRRTFSFVSAATADTVSFAFRVSDKSSTFKSSLLKLRPEALLRLSHIAGNFTLPSANVKPLLFIAGGIGITPFHSMIRSLETGRNIILLYVTNSPQDAVFTKDFNDAAEFGVRTKYINGRLDPRKLPTLVPDIKQRLIYISGPDAMVNSYKKMLKSLGIKNNSIRTDHFSGY